MAKLQMLKMPKAPKANASVATKEKYLQKLAVVKKENDRRKKENDKSDALSKRIAAERSKFKN